MNEKPVSAPPPGATPLGLWRGMLLFAPLVLLGNFVGASLRYPEIGSAVVFPPYAALTAALLLTPRRNWIWYIAVAAVAHFVASWPHWSLSWVLLSDVANIARALTATFMLQWALRGHLRLDDVDTLARFALGAVIVAPAVGATLGAANVLLHGGSTYWHPWSEWFMSNALAGLTILPAFVLGGAYVARWRAPQISRKRLAEAVTIAAGLIVGGALAFLVPVGARWQLALLLYAPLPVLIWAALRFGTGAVCFGLTAITFVAIWSAGSATGLFASSTPDESILVLQLFVLLTGVPVLCIAAVSGARRGVVQLHRALLASLHDHVAILDAQAVVVEVNESWRRFADTPAAGAFDRVGVGGSYLNACRAGAEHGDPIAVRALAGVSRVLAREVTRVEMEYGDHTGGHRRYSLSIEALERGAGGAVVTRADVTSRHEEQMQMEEQRRELSHLARVSALGQLSGALAHELNQPLTSISNNAEAARHLLRRRPVDLPEIDAALGDILAEDRRAAQVIRRLRALLRRGEARALPVDAAELVTDVLELAHAELITRGVSATPVIGRDLPPVLADRVQLQQVLLNLILNACEAMQTVGAHRRRLSLFVARDANHVRFSVRDTGTGIPPALTEHLFEPFVTTKREGLGLGLSISRTIVASHGGRMWAENNTDGGATVHCLFPTVAAPATEDGDAKPRAAQKPSAAGMAASA